MTDIDPDEMALSFENIRLEKAEMKPVPMPAFSSRWGTLMFAAPWASLVALSLYVQSAGLSTVSAWSIMGIAFAGAVAGGVSFNRWMAVSLEKAAAFARRRPGYDLAVDEWGFRWATSNGDLNAAWEEATTAGEDAIRFYFGVGPRMVVVLPKRIMTKLQIERVREIIARLGPRRIA